MCSVLSVMELSTMYDLKFCILLLRFSDIQFILFLHEVLHAVSYS